MTVIITMAGLGSRFTLEGYTVPKYKIIANGKSLFAWAMLSLTDFYEEEFLFCTVGTADRDWIFDSARNMGISNVKIFSRNSTSRGQAETAFDALADVSDNERLWIYNIDTYVELGLKRSSLDGCDGVIDVFPSKDVGMSYLIKDNSGLVVEIAEKRLISNLATIGLYGFSSKSVFIDSYIKTYELSTSDRPECERYVAPMYQCMIESGLKVRASEVDINHVHILGTPSQVKAFDEKVAPPFGSEVLIGPQ
jgi:choline kinase